MITPLSKPTSRATAKRDDLTAKTSTRRAVYGYVTTRDRRRCRACGRTADPNAADLLRHGHHHHVQFRSAGGADTKENLALLCNGCHADVHAHRLTVTGDAEGELRCERGGDVWISRRPQ